MQRFFLTVLIALFALPLFSQISVTPTAGCAPLVNAQFTGLTGATGILWNFGDATSSNINNPTHTYASAGTYTVTYSATVSGSPVTQTLLVNAYPKPNPNFTYTLPTSHCAPMQVCFTDASTAGGTSTLSSFQWSFGDGGTTTTTNSAYCYTYTIPGTFNVTLIAKNSFGCDAAVTQTAIVKVSATPTTVISSNPLSLSSCTVPFTATFSGSNCVSGAPGGGPLTYTWNLGNSQTSTQQNPGAITYTANGTYSVSLSVTDNNSCSKTVTVPVTLLQPKVKVLVKPTICYNVIEIFRDSSDAGFTTWNFGDGTPVQNIIPNLGTPPATATSFTHQFTSPGTKTITVQAVIGGCTDTKIFVVNVEQVTANFTALSPTFSCNSPFIPTYTNTSSSNATSFIWSMENHGALPPFTFSATGAPATAATPGFTITQGSLNPYTIFDDYAPTVTLVAVSAAGCKDTITKNLHTLRRITAYFFTDKKEGCAPLTVNFYDTSFSLPPSPPVNSYTWNFGPPTSTVVTTATTVAHTFNTPGTYTAVLTISNAAGCTDVSFIDTIHVGSPPSPSFNFGPSTVCPDQPVTFTNTSAPTPTVNHWHVTSDLGYFSHCITDPNPSWAFNHTGVFGFTMTAYNNGCAGSTASTQSVTVKGPIARGRYYTRCDDQPVSLPPTPTFNTYSVQFVANLQDTEKGVWDYGDGSPTQTITGVGSFTTSHTYTASGNYTATITGYNTSTGCLPFTDTLVVIVRKINALITGPSIGCQESPPVFDATTSQDVHTNCVLGYQWYFDNNPPRVINTPTVSNSLSPGTHTVMLVVRDENGCRDTARTFVNISYVTPSVTATSTVGCMPSFVFNSVNNFTSDAPMTFVWNFGDGSPSVSGLNPSHTYVTAASPFTIYNVTVTGTNSNGCIGTFNIPVQVNAPLPIVTTAPNNSICVNSTITFSGTNVPGASNYTWNWGDGSPSQSTTSNPVPHTFANAGAYTVTLTITDAAGCVGTNTYPVYVQAYPQAIITMINPNPSSNVACSGSLIQFQDNSVNPFPATPPRIWDLGTGSAIAPSQTTGNIFPIGNFPISLTVTSSFGCADVATFTLPVVGASADFSMSPTAICKNQTATLTITDTSNVFTWNWDYGDGTINTNSVSPSPHTYTFHPPGGSTNVTLTYWSSNLACKYSVVKSLIIHDVIADFDRNNELIRADSIHCQGVQDVFNNTSTNSISQSWNFGDGATSSAFSPNHTYANPGTYTVSLAITGLYNCTDQIEKVMVIIPPPVANFTLPSVCSGQPSQFISAGLTGYTYSWTPSANLSCTVCPNPVATVTTSTTFTVLVTDPDGCTNPVVKSVYIQEPPKSINWDTTIVIGQQVYIPGYAGTGFTYTWNPTTSLSCTSCPYPITNTEVDIVYTSMVADTLGCYTGTNSFTIHVLPVASVDVPTAFTPNGDGINDVIYVDGWGIKSLNYFRIYNRWGQLLFESNDIKIGWDGLYNGVPQNMETYVYQVSVETFIDVEPKLKKGTFKLIR